MSYFREEEGNARTRQWIRRSKVAIYLGSSPRHARLVALVLNLVTGCVSPQFHLKFDDFFETVQDLNALPKSKWQILSLFVTEGGESTQSVHPQGVNMPASRPMPSHVTGPPDPLDFD
jgi:hypothetical protein